MTSIFDLQKTRSSSPMWDNLIATLGLTLLLVACTSPTGAVMQGAEAPSAVSVKVDIPDTLPPDRRFPVSVSLTNTSQREVTLELAGKPELTYMTLVVLTASGDTVSIVPNASIHLRVAYAISLAPSESRTIKADFDFTQNSVHSLPPGDYFVRTQVLGSERIVSGASRLKVLP